MKNNICQSILLKVLQWPHCLLSPPRDQHCPVLTVKLTEHGPKMTFSTTCSQNGIIVICLGTEWLHDLSCLPHDSLSEIFFQDLEASVVQWLCHSPCKPGVASSIPGFSSPSDETLNRGPISI